MPKLKTIQAGPTGLATSRVNATANSFGAQQARGLGDLASGMQVAVDEYKRLGDEADILEAGNTLADLEFQTAQQFQEIKDNTPDDSTDDHLGQFTASVRQNLDGAIAGAKDGAGKKVLTQGADKIFNDYRMRMYGAEIDRGRRRQGALTDTMVEKSVSAIAMNPDSFIAKAAKDIQIVQASTLPESRKAELVAGIPTAYATSAANGKLQQAGTLNQITEFTDEINSSKWDSVLSGDNRLTLNRKANAKAHKIQVANTKATGESVMSVIVEMQSDLLTARQMGRDHQFTPEHFEQLREKYTGTGNDKVSKAFYGISDTLLTLTDSNHRANPQDKFRMTAAFLKVKSDFTEEGYADFVIEYGLFEEGLTKGSQLRELRASQEKVADKDLTKRMSNTRKSVYVDVFNAIADNDPDAPMLMHTFLENHTKDEKGKDLGLKLQNLFRTVSGKTDEELSIQNDIMAVTNRFTNGEGFGNKDDKLLNRYYVGTQQAKLVEGFQNDPGKTSSDLLAFWSDKNITKLPTKLTSDLQRFFNSEDLNIKSAAARTLIGFHGQGVDIDFKDAHMGSLGDMVFAQDAGFTAKQAVDMTVIWDGLSASDQGSRMEDAASRYSDNESKLINEIEDRTPGMLVDNAMSNAMKLQAKRAWVFAYARTQSVDAANGAVLHGVDATAGSSDFGIADKTVVVQYPVEKIYGVKGVDNYQWLQEEAMRYASPNYTALIKAGQLDDINDALAAMKQTGMFESDADAMRVLKEGNVTPEMLDADILNNVSILAGGPVSKVVKYTYTAVPSRTGAKPTYNIGALVEMENGDTRTIPLRQNVTPDYTSSVDNAERRLLQRNRAEEAVNEVKTIRQEAGKQFQSQDRVQRQWRKLKYRFGVRSIKLEKEFGEASKR